jgi:hypothetical protein
VLSSPSEGYVPWAIFDEHHLHGLKDVLLGLCGE